jgi:hypothetical protein
VLQLWSFEETCADIVVSAMYFSLSSWLLSPISHGKDEVCTEVHLENLRENTTGNTQALVGDRIETDLKEITHEDVNGIYLAPGWVHCQAFVNVIMNI